jgi:hypothetical protein
VGIETVTEIAPFEVEPRCVELGLSSGAVVVLEVSTEALDRLCQALRDSVSTPTAAHAVTPAVRRRVTPMRAALALLPLVVLGALLPFDAGDREVRRAAVATPPTSASGDGGPSSTTDQPTGTSSPSGATATDEVLASTSMSRSPTPTGVPVPVAPPPRVTVLAPLTGLPVEPLAVMRSAIVSKIDASEPAMPQVGLDQADIVMEVKIEGGSSRYLAVFHSRQPAVVGPHRSARTTDPDLLSMFGHPLFAFSGANEGVVDRLAATPWKTGVGPGEVPQAWFRDGSRPWPHNLFAWTEVLRSRPSPPAWPAPRFVYRRPDEPAAGRAVGGMAASVGAVPNFRWDGAIGGWRRWIHGRAHVHADGTPVAPTNVVVLQTPYGVSAADAASPEAVSTGSGRAWVLTDGRVVDGTWTRPDRFAPDDLRDGAGRPATLLPGSTWIVLADREPFMVPPG